MFCLGFSAPCLCEQNLSRHGAVAWEACVHANSRHTFLETPLLFKILNSGEIDSNRHTSNRTFSRSSRRNNLLSVKDSYGSTPDDPLEHQDVDDPPVQPHWCTKWVHHLAGTKLTTARGDTLWRKRRESILSLHKFFILRPTVSSCSPGDKKDRPNTYSFLPSPSLPLWFSQDATQS